MDYLQYSEESFEDKKCHLVLNLIINGLPSIRDKYENFRLFCW